MISLYRLEIFATVIREGSFSGAAEHLYLTQSAISQHIQSLEKSLGTTLFKRGRRGVTLTPAGEILWDYTRCMLQLAAEVENAVCDVGQIASGQLRIGATPGVGVYLLPEWIREFRTKLPNLTVSVSTGVTDTVVEGVLHQTLDLGMVEGDCTHQEGLDQIVLDTVTQYVIVGKSHPWYGQKEITFDSLSREMLISRPPDSQSRQWLAQIMAQYRLDLNIAIEFDTPEAIKQAVISGMGVAIMPDYIVRNEVALGLVSAISVSDVPLTRTVKLIWNRDEPSKPLTRAFLTYLSDRFPQLIKIQKDDSYLEKARQFRRGEASPKP